MEWELLGIVLVGLYGIVAYLFHFPVKFPYSYHPSLRDDRLDQIRGLAMIGIVCIHIHSYFEFFHPNDQHITFWTLYLSNVSRFSVPVFIFGSALYLKKKDGYWLNKFKSLVLPYLFASIMGYLLKYKDYTISDFLFRFLTGQVFAPYYFVPLLFQFYVLFFFLPSGLKKGKGLLLLFLCSVFLNLLSNLNLINNLFPEFYQPISIFNFLFFFSLGLVVRELPEYTSETLSFSPITLVILFLSCLGILVAVSLSNINLKNHHLIYPLLTILILNQFLPFETKNIFHQVLNFLGKNSLYIFLIHPFVIHQMHAFDPAILINPIFGYAITLVLNLGIPALIARIITFQLQRISNR